MIALSFITRTEKYSTAQHSHLLYSEYSQLLQSINQSRCINQGLRQGLYTCTNLIHTVKPNAYLNGSLCIKMLTRKLFTIHVYTI